MNKLLALLLAGSAAAHAGVDRFALSGKRFEVRLPQGWKSQSNYLRNVPMAFFGPPSRNMRPALLAFSGSPQLLKAAEKEYLQARKSNLEEQGATVLSTTPFAAKSMSLHKNETWVAALRFNVDEVNYLEQSYVVKCQNSDRVIYFQGTYPSANSQLSSENFDQIVGSIRCIDL